MNAPNEGSSDADNRPNLRIRVEEPIDNTQGRLSFNMLLENQGNVPAHITICEVEGGFEGQPKAYDPLDPLHRPVGMSIEAHEQKIIPLTTAGDGFPNPVHQFNLHIWVQYHGGMSKLYSANFYITRTHGSWEEATQVDTENS